MPGAEQVSRWFLVDQARIDAFAALTEDRQFIHVDPRAAAATPFGGTIAHGFLTLSLVSAMAYDALPPAAGLGVNYGFDRLRFIAPVRAGSRLRGRFRLIERSLRAPGRTLSRFDLSVEIEGGDRPALAGLWLTLSMQATS